MEITILPTETTLLDQLEVAKKGRINNVPESIAQTQAIINEAKELQLNNVLAKAQNVMGLLLMIIGKFEESNLYSNQAIAYFKSNDDKQGIADATFNKASTYYKTDDFYQGLQLMLECLQLYGELNDFSNKARVLKSIGTIYEYLGDTNRAIESYENCIADAQKANELNTESNAYNSLSGTYLKLDKIELARELAQKSIAIKQSTNDMRGLGFSIYARGKVFLKLNQYELAIPDFKESLLIHKQMGDRLGEGMTLNKLGQVYYKSGAYHRAIEVLKEAVDLGEAFYIKLITYKAHFTMYLCYKVLGDLQSALQHYESYNFIKESINHDKTSNVIKSYESIYRVEVLEREAKAQKLYSDIIEAKNVELDSFFYRVSHDLKGPISSLMGLKSIIQYEQFDTKAMKYFDMYNAQFLRMNMIVMDLINLTKMNNFDENKTQIDFGKLISACVESYEYLPNFTKIKFIYKIEPSLGFSSQWVIVNTILQNLIENSIKYADNTADNSFVKVSISRAVSNLKISVADNGAGISSVNQTKIFDMFFRADDKTAGTGLGLYILKRAVERLHGKIELESKIGVGTRFDVYLPY